MLIELGALVLIVNSTFSLVTRRSKDWKRGSWSARRQIYRTNRFPNGDINPQYSAPPSFSIQGFDHHPRWSNQTRGTEWSAKLRKNLSRNDFHGWKKKNLFSHFSIKSRKLNQQKPLYYLWIYRLPEQLPENAIYWFIHFLFTSSFECLWIPESCCCQWESMILRRKTISDRLCSN